VERISSAVSLTFAGAGRADLEASGMQRQQRDPVGQDVVHLAGDPCALGHLRAVFVQTLVGLGP
jgi:hypothetical protein